MVNHKGCGSCWWARQVDVGNVLLGRSVLPTGALPLTAVATIVRVGGPERTASCARARMPPRQPTRP